MIERGRNIGKRIREALKTATHRPTVEEIAERQSVLRGFVLEALDEIEEGQWFQIRSKIDEFHPVPPPGRFWGSGTQATKKDVLKTLNELKAEGLAASTTNIEWGPLSRTTPVERALWRRVRPETPPPTPPARADERSDEVVR